MDSTPTGDSRSCSCDHVFVSQPPLRCDAHTHSQDTTYVAHKHKRKATVFIMQVEEILPDEKTETTKEYVFHIMKGKRS